MRKSNFGILYICLVIIQMIICTYFQISPYVVISILPAIVLCIPLSISTNVCMLIAFISGLSIDWLAEGLIGINAAAVLPVAFARKAIIRRFIGEDLIARKESFSFKKNGAGRISIALFVSLSIFFICYIFLDGAGTRPFLFNLVRYAGSLTASLILSLAVVNVLIPDDRR